MRRFILLMLLCVFGLPTIIYAQSGCDIDLEDEISRLVQAQRAADSGDSLTAASILQAVQSDIQLTISGCDRVRLDAKYTAPDESVAFFHPEGWRVQILDQGLYLVASVPNLDELFDSDLPENLEEGEAAIAIQVRPIDDSSFDEIVDEGFRELLRDFTLIGRTEEELINGRRHIKVSVSVNDNVSGRIGFVDYTDAETPAVVLMLGLANRASLPIIEVYTDTLRKSLQYPPTESLRTSGTQLDDLSYSEVVNIDTSENFSLGRNNVLSPDGTMLAYYNGEGICVADTASFTENCTPLADRFRSQPSLLQWSPDGRYVAFQENFVQMFIEPDIWLLHVDASVISNLTDDGDADFEISGEFETQTWLDSVMTWGPDNQIYVLRTAFAVGAEREQGTYELVRVDPDTGVTTLLQDLTGYFEFVPVYYQQIYSLDGVMSVSPGGSQMVIVVQEFGDNTRNNGLWLIDLQGNTEPKHIATPNQFRTGYNLDFYEGSGNRIIESVAWNADGDGLFVFAISPQEIFFFSMAYHMRLSDGEILPMIDLSSYERADLLDDVQHLVPLSPAIAPDYSGVIFMNLNQPQVVGVSFDGEWGDYQTLYEGDDLIFAEDTVIVAQDGTAMLNGNLLRPD